MIWLRDSFAMSFGLWLAFGISSWREGKKHLATLDFATGALFLALYIWRV